MQFLRNLVDKQRKLYHGPDSPLHKVWPLLDAGETFLFAPDTKTPASGPHVRDYIDLKRTMWTVILALIPCVLFSFYNTGYQHYLAIGALAETSATDIVLFGVWTMVPIILVSYVVGLGIEGVFSVVRKEEVSEGYLVSGILIAMIVPPTIPLWQLAFGVAFSVILCKEVFGGTGMNIFNPALMTRAFLFFAFAGQMSGSKVWVAGDGAHGLVDGFSSATPLAAAAESMLTAGHYDTEGLVLVESAEQSIKDVQGADLSWADLFWGFCSGSAGETSTFCVLLGAILLLVTGVASWRVMAAGVIGLFSVGWLMNFLAGHLDGIGSLPPHYHLVMGGFAFGIVFMATDPVSSPETNTGKWIYGLLIGGLTVLVRAVNPAYPEGTMLAILLMNAFAPTIDHFVVAANVRRRKRRMHNG